MHLVFTHLQSRLDTVTAYDEAEDVDIVCHKIHLASLNLPFRTACLENALVSALRLANHGIATEFVIGIQPAPFMAHAWINHQGQVVLDRPDLNAALIPLVRISGKTSGHLSA